MPGYWTAYDAASMDKSSPMDGEARVIATTGPLATDPTQQAVGVLIQNKGRLHAIRVRTLLYNVDACPRRLMLDSTVLICPGCTVGIAYPNPGDFYEVELAAARHREDVSASIYGLGPEFAAIAANTLHWEDLTKVRPRGSRRRDAPPDADEV